MTMFTKLPAFAFLLFVSILAAAQSSNSHFPLIGVPYTLTPHINAPIVVGEVAPARVGNEECPSAVSITSPSVHGVPILFLTSAYEIEGSDFIHNDTDLFITFISGSDDCGQNIWGDAMVSPVPWTVPIELIGTAAARIYAPTNFRIKREGGGYRIYSPRVVENGVAEYNIVRYKDKELYRLGLSTVESPQLFNINEVQVMTA